MSAIEEPVVHEEGEKKRTGGKGGRGGDGKGDGEKKGGKGGKERKPRPPIPTFDDPEAELAKAQEGGEPPKPNRDSLERKIGNIQGDIDGNKRRVEAITNELDAIKAKNEKLKQAGAGPQQQLREALSALKTQIIGVIAERKELSASIDKIREKGKAEAEAIAKQRQRVGKFDSDEAINDEIRRIEEYMSHTSLSIKQEKEYMNEIKDLNKRRDDVKALEELQGKRGKDGTTLSTPELFEARKKVDEKLNILRAQEKTLKEQLDALRDKSKSTDSGRFETLLEERKTIRDKINVLIQEIRDMRKEHSVADDKWYEHDRLVKNLKWQIRQKKEAEREAQRKAWEAKKEEDKEAWEKEQEYRKTHNEDGTVKEKFVDWDLAERITRCEQLQLFLEKYLPKEASEVEAKEAKAVAHPDGVAVVSKDRQVEDCLGLNAFMVDEVVSKKSKKKDKKKAKNAEKNNEALLVAEGEVVTLQLSLEMVQQFASMGLSVPVDSSDAAASLEQLKAKHAYYVEKGDAGMTLKEVLKEEKAGRNKKSGKAEEKEEEPTEAAEPAEEEKAAEPEDKRTKGGPDWNAEKIARKLADAPEIDPDLDIAALRAKAQGAAMSDEEKKARGLLYDTSKASAVREESSEDEDEDACDFEGGDPFDGL